jgi:hypothetical protein
MFLVSFNKTKELTPSCGLDGQDFGTVGFFSFLIPGPNPD